MVFAGPPEDDVDWADVSPAGAKRFLARAWRLAGDVTSPGRLDPAAGDRAAAPGHARARCTRPRPRWSPSGSTWRWPGHGAGQRRPQGDRLRVRAAATRRCARPPRLSPSCCRWSRRTRPRTCGPRSATSRRWRWPGWPSVDPALLVEDTVTCVVQIAGKVRDRLEVAAATSARTSCASWRWPSPGGAAGAGRREHQHRDRPRAEAGQRRPGLTHRPGIDAAVGAPLRSRRTERVAVVTDSTSYLAPGPWPPPADPRRARQVVVAGRAHDDGPAIHGRRGRWPPCATASR